MKSLTVAVFMKEPGCSRDLARGLAEQGNKWIISACEGEIASLGSWEILVTDIDLKEALGAEFWASRVVYTQEPWPVNSIAGKIMEMAAELGWKEDATGLASECRIAAFFSLQGGSGVTSAALTAGRFLSGAYGERVLYLPLTYRDGSLCCRSGTGDAECRSVKELDYRFRHGRPFSIGIFTIADEYGLEYFSVGWQKNFLWEMTGEELDFFLQKLRECSVYSWILADCGSGPVISSASVRIGINNLQDCRPDRECGSLDAEFRIHNHGLENRAEVQDRTVVCEVIHDGESFSAGEQGETVISMSKSYAAGMKKFTEMLMETVPNLDDSW